MRAAPALLLALCAALPAQPGATASRLELGVASSLQKLRPGDPLPRERAVDLVAARGECEAAQIAVRSPAGLAALGASAAPLRGPPPPQPRSAPSPAPQRGATEVRGQAGRWRSGGKPASSGARRRPTTV